MAAPAATASQQRQLSRRALLLVCPPLLLLLLPSGVAPGSPCFMNKMCRLRRRTIHLNREIRDILPDSEAQYETITSIPEAQETSLQIFGKEERTAAVYIPIYSNHLILNCLTEKLLMQRIFDPVYQWTGPLGQITKESQRFVLTDDGNLELYNIQGSDSGGFTCKVNYMYNGEQLTTEINFMVYVYHMPEKSINLLSEFTSESCENNIVASFEKYLLEKLESLVNNLGCEIQQWSTQCHSSTDSLEKITHRITFQFVVFPLVLTVADFCRSSQCENSTSNIKKAYARIKQFFDVQNTDSSPSNSLNYISGSLTGVKVDHCKPGFGKNVITINNNTMCPGCCGILSMWIVLLISSGATSLILVTIWLIITKCCRKTIAAQYIKEAESELKKRLQTFANIASDAEIQKQRSKLSPIKVQRKDQSKYKVDFLEESVGLLSNDEVTEPSTTTGASPTPDQTGASELETSFEDQPSPILGNDFIPKDLPSNQQKLVDIMKHNPS
ncbi:zona pellucida-binding protein 1-like isoform X3 [Hemicordylus capensis]|uniref:zona pellucida-binding protein 1-like isoform X3 n=1 Tax=Hemicordylus capensis TaxID=884348 RepID=UPI002303CA6A|nr:zona pellucida-binding protein 1-like isoform X3 [Hemicordylus capensis]